MKKCFILALSIVAILTACNKSNQFKVNVNLDNSDGQTVYLTKNVDGKNVGVDTAVIVDNKAVLTADCDDPQTVYALMFKDNIENFIELFPDNQDVTITGDFNDFRHVDATGSATQNDYNEYLKHLNTYIDPFMEMMPEYENAMKSGDSLEYARIEAKLQKIMDDYNNYRIEYFKNHPDSYMAHFLLDQSKYDFELDDVKEVAEGFTTETAYSKKIKEYVDQYARVEIGQPFIDFTLKTVDGKDVNLDEVIKNNKVTLVDFWASWCGPCRDENPNVVAAYNKFHDKGLEIIGVSVDKNEKSWLKAVEEDGLSWAQTRDTDGKVATNYVIVYIPSNFLFDQNGVIIAKNLRGEELEAKLAELLK